MLNMGVGNDEGSFAAGGDNSGPEEVVAEQRSQPRSLQHEMQ